jgi:DNA polymerase I-like protein with 3'-5' exonuclease and polymerase domains
MSGKNMVEPDLTNLQELKKWRYKQIDARTGELIKLGFVYSGKTFSLSQNAQINILGLDNAKDDPALTYPISYNTIDDLDSYDVVDSNDIHSMYLTALATKKSATDSGTSLKKQVRDAADVAAVNAIVDNR